MDANKEEYKKRRKRENVKRKERVCDNEDTVVNGVEGKGGDGD